MTDQTIEKIILWMNKLITELEQTVNQPFLLQIKGFLENQIQPFTITFDVTSADKKITDRTNIPAKLLNEILWRTGHLPMFYDNAEYEKRFLTFIKSTSNRAKVIAIDTNIIIRNVIPNLSKQFDIYDPESPFYHSTFPIILISSFSLVELSYQADQRFKNTKIPEHLKKHLNDISIAKPHVLKALIGRQTLDPESMNLLMKLKTQRGRRGFLALQKIDSLKRNYPHIIIKSPNLVTEHRATTSTHNDLLIVLDFEFFHRNTTSDLVFLSADKNLILNAESFGFKTIFIKQPHHNTLLLNHIGQKKSSKLTIASITKIIDELLEFSPYIEITPYIKNTNSYQELPEFCWALTADWVGRSISAHSATQIRAVALAEPKNIIYLEKP